jgi:hypothetical protein
VGNGSSSPVFKDIIVAVHGIGQQSRYSTVRSVATRLAASKTLFAGGKDRPVAPQPLGYFHSEVRGITSVSLLDDAAILASTALASTGFAEVFWADIPEQVVQEGSTLEETKAWARTVVARAQALWMHAGRPGIVTPDFGLAAEVLDEIIETVYVLENLLFLADKVGLFKFALRRVLEDYLGDVQIVTEFANYRSDIVVRFHQAMADIYEEQRKNGNQHVRLHVVAHSEGTVVSFLGLLQAMSGQQLTPPASPNDRPQLKNTDQVPEWLKHVHGYMTIGSPIDKHLLLWPRLWSTLKPALADAVLPAGQIKWRNYYDYGDPIGFKLDTARRWLDHQQSKAFQFCGCPACRHDIGFARYLLPGKAHNDYWNDPDVFEHFVDDVVAPPKTNNPAAKRPTDRPIIPWLSPALPYFLSAVVLVVGVYLLYNAVTNFTNPNDPLTKYFLITAIGVEPTPGVSRWELFLNTLGISGLIAGVTLFARFPRLAAGREWKIAGAVAFGIGCVVYSVAVTESSQRQIGAIFAGLGRHGPTIGVLLLALIVGILGFLVTGRAKQDDEDRRQRWFWRGMRPMLLCGAFAVAVIVASELYPQDFGLDTKLTADEAKALTKEQREIIKAAGFDRKELDQLFKSKPDRLDRIARVKPFLTTPPPVWPVLLSAIGFLYLWWLATLIFDLAFVWQRYIRRSVANQRLREWGPDALRQSGDGLNQPEQCRNPARTSSGAQDGR